jgi:hypothetical protein
MTLSTDRSSHGRGPESLLTWVVHEYNEDDISADFRRGRYTVSKHTAYGLGPWYVARWHRSRRVGIYTWVENVGPFETMEEARGVASGTHVVGL